MVGELSSPELLKILGANGWKSDAARVRNNKIPMQHPDKTFPDTYVILHFPHLGVTTDKIKLDITYPRLGPVGSRHCNPRLGPVGSMHCKHWSNSVMCCS